MGIISIILGVLLALAGIACLLTPAMTLMSVGYFIIIMLFVYGVAAVVNSIATKTYGITLVFGIISVIFGIVGIIHPGDIAVSTDMFLVFLAAVWFVAQGVYSIIMAFNAKKLTGKFGWLALLVGILALIVGVYSFIHPFFAVVTLGMLISFFVIESGISLITIGVVQRKKDK